MKSYLLTFAAMALLLAAQTAVSPAGRWEGEIKVPGQGIAMVLELARGSGGGWQGVASFPSQADTRLRLLNLKVEGADISFDMPGAPGYPAFKGKVSAEGSDIRGDFTQAGQSIGVELKRKGDPSFKASAPPALPAAAAALKGNWEGALEVGGQTLRLKLILPLPEGDLPGLLDSLDQQTFIPIDAILADQGGFRVDLKLIQGSFTGKLSPDGASWQGVWEQPGVSIPITFKRSANPKN